MADDSPHRFGNETLEVAVKADGAELTSIRTAAGRELLWQAGPEWPRHAPVLFPIVGRLAGDTLRHQGRSSRMTQHGFARDRRFAWADRGPAGCRLVLSDDAQSRAIYPFGFRLEIEYRLQAARLAVEYRLVNTGTERLPASLGAHPAFRWPLADGVAKPAHRLVFAEPEPAPTRRVEGGLLRAEAEPSPIAGRVLALDEALFTDDALILERPASRSVTFEAEGVADAIEVAWHGMAQLGIWSKPGADFLCIEPWRGLASPAGFDGDFADKPFLMQIEPGAQATLGWSVTLLRR